MPHGLSRLARLHYHSCHAPLIRSPQRLAKKASFRSPSICRATAAHACGAAMLSAERCSLPAACTCSWIARLIRGSSRAQAPQQKFDARCMVDAHHSGGGSLQRAPCNAAQAFFVNRGPCFCPRSLAQACVAGYAIGAANCCVTPGNLTLLTHAKWRCCAGWAEQSHDCEDVCVESVAVVHWLWTRRGSRATTHGRGGFHCITLAGVHVAHSARHEAAGWRRCCLNATRSQGGQIQEMQRADSIRPGTQGCGLKRTQNRTQSAKAQKRTQSGQGAERCKSKERCKEPAQSSLVETGVAPSVWRPMQGVRCPMQGVRCPMQGVRRPYHGVRRPMQGVWRPMQGVQRPQASGSFVLLLFPPVPRGRVRVGGEGVGHARMRACVTAARAYRALGTAPAAHWCRWGSPSTGTALSRRPQRPSPSTPRSNRTRCP